MPRHGLRRLCENPHGAVQRSCRIHITAAGHRYQIADKRLIFAGGSTSIDYFIGSNAADRTFVREREGYLFELPVTWYAQKQSWDASPGYEDHKGVHLTRAVEASCLQCHASRVRPVLGTQNRFGDPRFSKTALPAIGATDPAANTSKTRQEPHGQPGPARPRTPRRRPQPVPSHG